MKNILIVSLVLVLTACGGIESTINSDGSSKTTYSSCQITDSKAIFASDRTNDLRQCWNAIGQGYTTKASALSWCKLKVSSYISSEYIFGHTVEYSVKSNNCS